MLRVLLPCRATGTRQEMALDERSVLAFDGVVVAAVDVFRAAPGAAGGSGPAPLAPNLSCKVRLTTRGMWLDKGELIQRLREVRRRKGENGVGIREEGGWGWGSVCVVVGRG